MSGLPPRGLRMVREPRGFGPVLVALCCVPAAFALAGVASDVLLGTRWFGANPIKAVEHYFGEWTLRFLLATLAVTPLRRLSGWVWLTRHRRSLGLAAFGYLMAHWLTYALIDVQLDWHELLTDLAKRPYIMIGMTALVLMVPLAVTSTRAMRRRLAQHWARLHLLIHPIAILGVVHYWMSVKQDVTEPLIYALILGSLFAARLWVVLPGRVPRAVFARKTA
jgi:methionine sulfoxide reductase heme-binding subunit